MEGFDEIIQSEAQKLWDLDGCSCQAEQNLSEAMWRSIFTLIKEMFGVLLGWKGFP
jgi:hypothetical protein